MSRRGATADWPLEVGGRTSELGLEAAARTVADSSRGPIADRETHRRQPALVVVEVVALLVVHREIQTVVVGIRKKYTRYIELCSAMYTIKHL